MAQYNPVGPPHHSRLAFDFGKDESDNNGGYLLLDFGSVVPRFVMVSQTPRSFSPGRIEYYVEGEVGKDARRALPDTRAEFNSISATFASTSLGIFPQEKTEKRIRLPSGHQIVSPGLARVPFRFRGEKQTSNIECLIVPECRHNLILSGSFLRATKTLTMFKHRIKNALRGPLRRLGFNLMDSQKQRLWGHINGISSLAVPDTGSDVMLVSAAYAKSHGLKIERDLEHCLELELVDGSVVVTSGMVREATWRFGNSEENVICDFYVLDDLSVDVVLSNDFLFEYDVFSKYEECLVETRSTEEAAELYNIRLIGKYSPDLQRLEDLYINDSAYFYGTANSQFMVLAASAVNSPDAFSPLRVQAELHRRDDIEDIIHALDSQQQEAAWRDERERQKQWEELRDQHRRSQENRSRTNVDPISGSLGEHTGVGWKKWRRWMLRIPSLSQRSSRTNSNAI